MHIIVRLVLYETAAHIPEVRYPQSESANREVSFNKECVVYIPHVRDLSGSGVFRVNYNKIEHIGV